MVIIKVACYYYNSGTSFSSIIRGYHSLTLPIYSKVAFDNYFLL